MRQNAEKNLNKKNVFCLTIYYFQRGDHLVHAEAEAEAFTCPFSKTGKATRTN